MAGTIPSYSLSQQCDINGKPLSGGKLYFYQAGTTSTPQNAYSDSGLTNALANPITLDSAGRIPQFFLADGNIKIKLTDANGVVQVSQDNILVVGASSGGGGGATVDASTVLSTGDIKLVYGTGTLSGFVRANGRTIGSASSGASERANADTEDLYVFLWGVDANLSVSGGRGASGAADFAANKTLTLPDFRGRVLASLDDMGSSASGRLTSTYFGTSPIVLGAASTFQESRTLVTGNLPAYTPAGSVSSTFTGGRKVPTLASGDTVGGVPAPATGSFNAPYAANTWADSTGPTSTFTGTAQGGSSTPLSIIQPTILITSYLKL